MQARAHDDLRKPTLFAMAGASCMLAHQVAGKAARDGFFLLEFPASDLPRIVVCAALLSLGLAILFSRLLARVGPARLVPSTFAVSGLLHIGEWLLLPLAPETTVVLIYLHIVGLGAILLSGFWSLLNEVFDPREAKRQFGRIAGIGTAGGILGGVAAERVAAWASVSSLLFLLAGLHLVCSVLAFTFHPAPQRRVRPQASGTALRAFRRTPLLWQLAALVFVGTCTAALLDYLFKLGAASTIGKGPALVRYFAIYYTGCQILTFVVQVALNRWLLQAAGIARAVASLPIAVGAASGAALLVPVYPLVVVARAVEVILRGSVFRSGYELLYTPVPQDDKRSVKTIVDVGCDRLGDAVGAGAVQLMVWLGPELARPEILGLAILLSAVSATLALKVDRAYRSVLERGLVERARVDDSGQAEDPSMMNTMFDGMPSVQRLPVVKPKPAKSAVTTVTNVPVAAAVTVREAPKPLDPTVAMLTELRCQDLGRVTRALRSPEPWDPLVVPQVIRLLAWDEASGGARVYLEKCGGAIAGQLTDALVDQNVDFGIRRRIPRLLARIASPAAVEGLLQGLQDQRFEVRFQCGRALEYISRKRNDVEIRSTAIFAAVQRELSVSKSIWRSWRVLDRRDSSDDYNFLDEVLRERSDHSLEHVFSLLAIVLPREPLMAAFRALHQEDRMFRGLALEYLETILPQEIRDRLWAILEEEGNAPDAGENTEQHKRVLEELLVTDAKLVMRLRELRKASTRQTPRS